LKGKRRKQKKKRWRDVKEIRHVRLLGTGEKKRKTLKKRGIVQGKERGKKKSSGGAEEN